MSEYVLSINGEFLDEQHATVSVLDHGFLFGDSVYEVFRTVGGRLFAADRHLRRLHASANAIEMALQRDDAWILEHLHAMHAHRGGGESYLRLIVTRGVGRIDLHPESCLRQNFVGIAKAINIWPREHYEQGCKVILADVRRNPKQATDPAIKSGNYLNNVLALIEARRHGAAEAVMLNLSGHLTEATTSNVFLVSQGKVLTPALREGLLDGITRQFVREACQDLALHCQEAELTTEDLYAAEEIFLTSTTRDVMPVGRVGEHRVPNAPGPVTARIAEAYQRLLHDPANLS
jgi:branched-chain amino acid aminotransferase